MRTVPDYKLGSLCNSRILFDSSERTPEREREKEEGRKKRKKYLRDFFHNSILVSKNNIYLGIVSSSLKVLVKN